MNFLVLILLHATIAVYAWIVTTQDMSGWYWWSMMILCATVWTSCFHHLIAVLKERD